MISIWWAFLFTQAQETGFPMNFTKPRKLANDYYRRLCWTLKNIKIEVRGINNEDYSWKEKRE